MTINEDFIGYRNAVQDAFRKGKPWEGVELVRQAEGCANWKDTHLQSEWFFQLKVWSARYQADVLLECAEWKLDSEGIFELAGILKKGSEFSHARRLLARLAGEPVDLLLSSPKVDSSRKGSLSTDFHRKIIQSLALCTYKDPDLHPARALNEAERLLNSIGLDGQKIPDEETLGQGGAVFKRRWELTGQVEYLYQSLNYYRKSWKEHRDGYGGINAAFILDKIADWFSTRDENQAQVNRTEAQQIRLAITQKFPGSDAPSAELLRNTSKWDVATLAEAFFGLGGDSAEGLKCFDCARKWFAASAEKLGGEWERKTCFQQVATLGRLRGYCLPTHMERDDTASWHPAWRALAALLDGETDSGEKTYPALTGYPGKVGLALSGGGFRAAFYHLGVMARLAEIDALRRVEVISTVSGGSIMGAHYALKLKKMMEEEPAESLTRGHYIELMKCLIPKFYQGVSGNMRMRALSSIKTLWGMIFNPECSTTRRLGELYGEEFFAPALGRSPKSPVKLTDLLIQPKGDDRAFSPRNHNWRVTNKIPILLLNATNLNSGHSWQFTGAYMGEPPGLLEADIDANQRFARFRFDAPEETYCISPSGKCHLCGGYVKAQSENPVVKDLCKEAPEQGAEKKACNGCKIRVEYREFHLGRAVAASSCVPLLFTPVLLGDIYPGQNLRLADGGVYDNQGVDTLLQENCTLLFCSDASGQLCDEDSPSIKRLDVFRRANDITMERDRILQYQDMRGRLEDHTLGGMMFVHLRQGLDIRRIAPCEKPNEEQGGTGYGFSKKVQRLLSRIRTDLDSFSEVEAYSLMLSGYRASGVQLDGMKQKGLLADFDTHHPPETDWPFLVMEPYVSDGGDGAFATARQDVEKQLGVAEKLFFKPYLLDNRPKLVSCLLAVALAGLIWRISEVADVSWASLALIAIKVLVFPVATLGGAAMLINLPSSIRKRDCWGGLWDAFWHGADVMLTTVLCVSAWFQLLILNNSFLERGKLSQLKKTIGQ